MRIIERLEGAERDAALAYLERALNANEDEQPPACTCCGKQTDRLCQDGVITWLCVECLNAQ